ncbi:MAG: MoxR family ATPase, partial [Chloroflexota bacterium]
RFLLRVRLGYPSIADEVQVLEDQQLRHPIEAIKSVFSAEEVLAAAESVKSVYVAASIKRYIVELTHRTRVNSDVYLGASPRGSLALFRAGQARAGLNGRDHVLPDDIKALAQAILGHRIIVNPAARLREVTPERIVQEILLAVAVPGGNFSV